MSRDLGDPSDRADEGGVVAAPRGGNIVLLRAALDMVMYERSKYLGSVFGVMAALFLVLLLSGFYFGFRRDITIIQDSFEVDLWITPRFILVFDSPAAFDDLVLARVLGEARVAAASRIVVDFGKWRMPGNGAMENVQVVGYEPASGIKAQWGFENKDLPRLLAAEGAVLVDRNDLGRLGIPNAGEFAGEILARRATVAGWTQEHHLFNVSCLVVTDLDNARAFLKLPSHATHYIGVKCREGVRVAEVADALRGLLPENSVYTSAEFHDLTQDYWQSLTGIAPMFFLSMILSGVVGFMTVFLTFYLLTSQKLPVFAAMKALGAATVEIGVLLGVQLAAVFLSAAALAALALLGALAIFALTPISVVLPGWVVAVDVGAMAVATALACVPSLWKVARAEPAEAFQT